MVEAPTFEELIRRVRAGDQDAAAVLVRRYEPAIRRAVRFRLADARLGNLLDSMDICQSVLGASSSAPPPASTSWRRPNSC